MGGIGKTTLARKVYNHASLKSQFEGFAWAYVSQQLQLGPVCREILLQLIPRKDEEERKSRITRFITTSAPKVYDMLKRTKCLVVLDDIWFIEDWNCLKHAFPLNDNSCDSKVLVSTRNSQIFSDYASHVVYYYEAKFLNPNQSWELSEKKTHFNKDNAAVHVGDSFPELESLANSTKLPHLKSLLLFRSGEISDYQSIGDISQSHELLRILDFRGIHCRSLPSRIGTLIYLRYLSLKDTGITELPSETGNLRSLIILDLRLPDLRLPDVLWKMKSLKQLYLQSSFSSYVTKDSKALRLDKLSHLEIIEGLNLDTAEVKGLQELSTSLSLQRLKAKCSNKTENLDPFLKSSTIKSMSLTMEGSIFHGHPKMLLDCHYLHRLMIIGGNFGDSITFPQNLVKLRFWRCQLLEETISVLEKLPQLKKLSLVLCKALFEWHIHISSNGFAELTHLMITNNHDLEEWTVGSGCLFLSCRNLKSGAVQILGRYLILFLH
ncbi:LOW QUALITY PROTEIN: hypothetical protein Cgig2_003116 [Carnegiea gigantea]|uniref:NB-ARC domain-containing protein n=1 Tax=Carnegiea gigantea TaxID=171969 RepID=A0A9Q1GZZ8_9CARY|nr:LOW QUALITY PROTEIN: hypothetical protein Cgig2_003116 [Carnegiea gigantea]